jgi:hypothetical protein
VAGGSPDPGGDKHRLPRHRIQPPAPPPAPPARRHAGRPHTLGRIIRRGNFDGLGHSDFVNATYLWFDLSTNTLGNVSSARTGFGLVSRSIAGLGYGYAIATVTFVAPGSSREF